MIAGYRATDDTYHDACANGDASPAVSVGYDVPKPYTQESNGNQPHGVQEVGVVLVVEPGNHDNP